MFLTRCLLIFFQFLCLWSNNSSTKTKSYLIRILFYHLIFIYGFITTTILAMTSYNSNDPSRYFMINGNIFSLMFMCYSHLVPIRYETRLKSISERTRAYLNRTPTLTVLNIIVIVCVVLLFTLISAPIYPLNTKVFYFFTELFPISTSLVYINHILCLHSNLNQIAVQINPRVTLNVYNEQILINQDIHHVYSVLIWLLFACYCSWQLPNFFHISVCLLHGNLSEINPYIIYSITKIVPMLAICFVSEMHERKWKHIEVQLSEILQVNRNIYKKLNKSL